MNQDTIIQFKNESGLEFIDISSESERTYIYKDGYELAITNPTHLHVSERGGHRLFTAKGTSIYIPPGWVAVKWKAHFGSPNFVK